MNRSKTRFLVLDGNSRLCLPVIRGISALGARVETFSPVRTHEVVFSLDDPKQFFSSALDLLLHPGEFGTEMKKRKRA